MTEKTKAGRPAHQPEEKDRKLVSAMASYGIPQDKIASVIGIDEKTLRKHYADEIDTAEARATAVVAKTLYSIATDRNHSKCAPAAMFWLKCRGGWREKDATTTDDFDSMPVPPRNLGKKEQAERDAETAGVGTDWGDDLTPPGMLN